MTDTMRHWFLKLLVCLIAVGSLPSWAESVDIKSYVRAETDRTLRELADQNGFSKFFHRRLYAPLDQQSVIRQNQDTLYSFAVFDLSEPVTLTLPDTKGRYMSAQIISQDHYSYVEREPGEHLITQDRVGTRFAGLLIRTFADPNLPEDFAAANTLQDQIKLSGGGKGPYESPNWNLDDIQKIRGLLNQLAGQGFETNFSFGMPDQVRPIDHLLGAAIGWGGLPQESALYDGEAVEDNVGTPHVLRVREVPVDAFWSVTVYNADGYLEPNDLGINSLNNVTAEAQSNGEYTIHFGECEDGRTNCIPITKGWNYTVRLYEPREEILTGDWNFPKAAPMPANKHER